MKNQAQMQETANLLEWIRLFNLAINDVRTSWQPSLALEVALVQAVEGNKMQVQFPRAAIQANPARVAKEDSLTNQNQAQPIKEDISVPPTAGNEPVEKEIPPAIPNPGINIQKIQENWNAIRVEVKKILPQTEALLHSYKSLQFKEGALVIGFSSEILKSKMETVENLAITRDAIQKVLGVVVRVQCVVVGNKSTNVSADMEIDADSIVGTALNLGGKLVHRE